MVPEMVPEMVPGVPEDVEFLVRPSVSAVLVFIVKLLYKI